MAWEDLPYEEKVSQIIGKLNEVAVAVHDPGLYRRYQDAKARTSDKLDYMRIDLAYYDLVLDLRKKGKIPPLQEIRKKAKQMVDLDSDALRKALEDFGKEMRA